MPDKSTSIIPAERIEKSILLIRGEKVILDADLAELYGVTTKRLNQQVRRNIERFPKDFAFQINQQEFDDLKLHFATSSSGWGGRRTPPLVYTEHGALMAANVLKTPTAIQASVQVVRVFVRMRQMLSSHASLARKLAEMESKYDKKFAVVFAAIKKLLTPPEDKSDDRPWGFRIPDKTGGK